MDRPKIKSQMVDILQKARWPLPTDEIAYQVGIKPGFAAELLGNIKEIGFVKSRECPEDRKYSEWWIVAKEKDLIFI